MAARDLIRVVYPICNVAVGVVHERNNTFLLVRPGAELDELIHKLTEIQVQHERQPTVQSVRKD